MTVCGALDGRLVGRSPRIEKLNQLLARAVIVPLRSRLTMLDQMIRRFLALPGGIERDARSKRAW